MNSNSTLTDKKVIDLTQIHRGQIVTESMRLFDSNLEVGTILLFPLMYRLTFNNQSRQNFFLEASSIQAYCVSTI